MKYVDELACDPKELAGLDPARTAHLCIDVQNYYFRDKGQEAEDVAGRIALVAKAFDRAGLRREIYAYHMEVSETPDFFVVEPGEGDIVLPKKYFSAFDETNLHTRLKAEGIENLILSGGYAFDCVSATAQDALARGYRTIILGNCLYDPAVPEDALMLTQAFTRYSSYGHSNAALISTSGDVLRSLRQHGQASATGLSAIPAHKVS